LTIAADQQATVGIATRFAIQGDFEITVGYEILEAERPVTGSGVGLELYLDSDTPAQHALAFHRIVRPKEGQVYFCDHKLTDEDGKRVTRREQFPAADKSGRLRLTRVGKQVTFASAEGQGEFRELCQHEFADEVKCLHVRAFHGKSQKAVNLRIADLRIRAPESPEVAGAQNRPSSLRLWILAGAGAGLLLTTFVIRRRMLRGRSNDFVQ
jgi:hypothetical protein